MIGVVVVPEVWPGWPGVDDVSLLPLGDRPVLQHIVEALATGGVHRIELLLGRGPDKVEALLGNGDRWGCRFRYHLVADPAHPYRSLRVMEGLDSEPWVLVHAQQLPLLDPRTIRSAKLVAFRRSPDASGWLGSAVFPPRSDVITISGLTQAGLDDYVAGLLAAGDAEAITVAEWIDVATPARLLVSQAKLLHGKLGALVMSGVERDPGIWVSRGVDTHRSARLIAPVYLGPHCRVYEDVVLGPNTVVSACSLIDRNTRIEASLIAEDSMIGEGLTLNRMVVTQGLVLDARTEDAVYVADIPSLADPRQPGQLRRFAESAVALLLLVLLLPISLIAYIYFALLRGVAIVTTQCVRLPQASRASTGSFALAGFGADAWSHTLPAGWEAFLRQFLPGLPAVFLGRLSLVGLPPVTPQQMEALPGEWQSIYLAGRPGLISEASVSAANADDQAQRYVADACYEAQRTPLHDARLMARYFAALILPR